MKQNPNRRPSRPPEQAAARMNQILMAQGCADALGAATEFMDEEAQDVYPAWPDPAEPEAPPPDFRGGGPFDFAPGEVTDDTQMSLALTWEITAPDWPALTPLERATRIRAHFVSWAQSSPPDIGLTTARALRSGAPSWQGQEAGNGALMRAGAVVAQNLGAQSALELMALQGAVTHLNPRSVLAGSALQAMCSALSRGESWARAGQQAFTGLGWALSEAPALLIAAGVLPERQRRDYRRALERAAPELEDATERGLSGDARNPSGYVVDTWRAALAYATPEAPSARAAPLAQAAVRAARGGGDSDTAAAVSAALCAAAGQYAPQAWQEQARSGHSWQHGAWQTRRGEPLMDAVRRACRQ